MPEVIADLIGSGPPLRAFILSGGLARRAGGINKSFVQVDGQAIIRRQLDRLRPTFGSRITVLTDRPEDYRSLGVACAADLQLPGEASDRSPLRGIASALSIAPADWCFLLAGDMPWPDPRILDSQWEWIRREQDRSGADVRGVCIEGPRGPEPFHAIYHGELASSALRALSSGDPSVRRWIGGCPQIRVVAPGDLGLDSEELHRCLVNVNTLPS
ncbi:molybdenum cofactor guanylyltransferase [Candidatus Sumerlaeota bacterium]|nr:molybdenum cofactor guanylyltransferase [Candidatus Sumerlaeota bacterium]